jgi:undecaprenol kinase
MKTKHSIADNFKFAYNGIHIAVKMGRNIKIMIVFGVFAAISGLIFNISSGQWLSLILIIALVLSLEMANTALEAVVDLVSPGFNEKAKIAKDMAAGAVLTASIASVIIGLIIFLPKIL